MTDRVKELEQQVKGLLEQIQAVAASPSQEPFELSAAPARSAKLSKADEERFSQLYKKNWRQIRRWIERGEERNDPCPLSEPGKMPAWWARNMKWRVPQEIEEAAMQASHGAPGDAGSAPAPEPAASLPATLPPTVPAAPSGRSVDLEEYDPEEGDRLRELKQIQAAKFADLKAALKRGEDCTLLETKYLKLCETIDKIETRVTERLKKRGLYILKGDVERDLAEGAELLRQCKTSMVRRVLELCPLLNGEQRDQVAAAIERARAAEERMLCKLDSMTGDDLLRELAS